MPCGIEVEACGLLRRLESRVRLSLGRILPNRSGAAPKAGHENVLALFQSRRIDLDRHRSKQRGDGGQLLLRGLIEDRHAAILEQHVKMTTLLPRATRNMAKSSATTEKTMPRAARCAIGLKPFQVPGRNCAASVPRSDPPSSATIRLMSDGTKRTTMFTGFVRSTPPKSLL